MEQRALGRSGIDVSRVILGCGNFGGIGSAPAFFGAGRDRGRGARAPRRRLGGSGSRRFDTADAYGGGRSEYVDRRLAAREGRRRARRGSSSRRRPSTRCGDGRRRAASRPTRIRRQLEASLERLGVDRSTSTWPTSPIPDTPLADTHRRLRRARPRRARSARSARSNVDGGRARGGARLCAGAGSRASSGCRTRTRCSTGPTQTGVLALCARARPRLHAVRPARRRLADREVPPRRAAPEGSRMTLRPEPYRRYATDARLRRARRARREARERGVLDWRRSRSPGCSRTRDVDRGRDRAAPAGAPRAGARGARARLSPAEHDRSDGALRMSVLVLVEHDVERAARRWTSASRRWPRCSRRWPAASCTSRSASSLRPPGAEALMGLCPRTAAARAPLRAQGDRDRAGQPGARARRAPGRRAPPRRRDRASCARS